MIEKGPVTMNMLRDKLKQVHPMSDEVIEKLCRRLNKNISSQCYRLSSADAPIHTRGIGGHAGGALTRSQKKIDKAIKK